MALAGTTGICPFVVWLPCAFGPLRQSKASAIGGDQLDLIVFKLQEQTRGGAVASFTDSDGKLGAANQLAKHPGRHFMVILLREDRYVRKVRRDLRSASRIR